MPKRGITSGDSDAKRSKVETFNPSLIPGQGDVDWSKFGKPLASSIERAERELWELKLWESYRSQDLWSSLPVTVPRDVSNTREWLSIKEVSGDGIYVTKHELEHVEFSRRRTTTTYESFEFNWSTHRTDILEFRSVPQSALIVGRPSLLLAEAQDEITVEFLFLSGKSVSSLCFRMKTKQKPDRIALCDSIACLSWGDNVYIISAMTKTIRCTPKPLMWTKARHPQLLIWARSIIDADGGTRVPSVKLSGDPIRLRSVSFRDEPELDSDTESEPELKTGRCPASDTESE